MTTPRDTGLGRGWPEGMPRTGPIGGSGQARAQWPIVTDHAPPSSPAAVCERCGVPKGHHASPLERWGWRVVNRLRRHRG